MDWLQTRDCSPSDVPNPPFSFPNKSLRRAAQVERKERTRLSRVAMATSQSKAGGGTDSRQYRLSLDADVRVRYDEKTGKIGADLYQLPPTALAIVFIVMLDSVGLRVYRSHTSTSIPVECFDV